jgi:hypothetical protein
MDKWFDRDLTGTSGEPHRDTLTYWGSEFNERMTSMA